jgi:hypothetical protein
MPVPAVATYSLDVRVAAQTGLLTALDSGTGAAVVRIRSASDVLLGSVSLSDPCGTVSGTTGVLTFSIAGQGTGSASGTAAYAEFCTSEGDAKLSIPALQGTAAVPGYFVMNSLSVVSGNPLEILSASAG